MKIANQPIGEGHTFVIAEMSANHEQVFQKAVALVHAAKEAGADAVKIQLYKPESLTIDCKSDLFKIKKGLWAGRTFYDLYKDCAMPYEWVPHLQEIAYLIGIILFPTVYDLESLEYAESLNMPAYKIASFDVCDHELLDRVARTKKPVIFSTGTSSYTETFAAKKVIKRHQRELAILHCISSYPAKPEEMNLRTIPDISRTSTRYTGLSDHSRGITAPIVAVSLGACIIEKHLKLPCTNSPDSAFSLEPKEFKKMTEAIRFTEKALGGIKYGGGNGNAYRRSLCFIRDVKKGQPLTRENIRAIRPNGGLEPNKLTEVIGKKAIKDIQRGTPLRIDLIA